ncbi:hypothetical protein HPP92_001172 [Vanilla planifolia]|uniref:Charged multivesicular body protein 7 n=1 Tax=Vanilla planifolia TaxID=51239 RepID=A0A835VHB4_VANPL|nr:hypothetical protein HPP92_001172 [Vanilla planifolia]
MDQVLAIFSPDGTDDTLILRELLQERAADVTKTLAARNWTSSCVITMKMFQSLCNGFGESTVILAYLCESRKAQYLSVRKKEFVEGIKLSLSSSSVSPVTNFDSDILHLMWTTEKLQQQVDTINQQWETSKKMALASLKSGNKPASYRHIRQAKLFSQKRAKCTSFLERVEEVLSIISDAESTKKVSEAIQIGTRAIKENRITVEEVNVQLQELDECVIDQKLVIDALERMPLQSDIEDEDIEEEFEKLKWSWLKQCFNLKSTNLFHRSKLKSTKHPDYARGNQLN